QTQAPTRATIRPEDYSAYAKIPTDPALLQKWQLDPKSGGGQCTDYAAWAFNAAARSINPSVPASRLLTDYPNAQDWMGFASSRNWKTSTDIHPDLFPAIVVYSGKGAGHVAVATGYHTDQAGNVDGIVTTDMNLGKPLPSAPANSYRDKYYGEV